MQLLGRLEIKSRHRIEQFLNEEHVGRIASIDNNGFPQVIPMNFVFADGAIYMHSHTRGEKLENIRRNSNVGFEADREIAFLPSYFTSPTDAAQADTLYVSVVIKGTGTIVSDRTEKTMALNALMRKYQPEGNYEPIRDDMAVVDEVAIIKILPATIKGKYKIGQHLDRAARTDLAKKILKRYGEAAGRILNTMGFEVSDGIVRIVDEPSW